MEAGMREQLGLLAHRLHQARVAVPSIIDGDAGGEVDEAAVVDVPQFRVQRTLRVDGTSSDTAGDGGGLAGGEL